MDRKGIEEIRARVSCVTVFQRAGFVRDESESSRNAVKFRRGAEVFIVNHQGAGWFDPLSERKGDIFALVMLLEAISFPTAVRRLEALTGLDRTVPTSPAVTPRPYSASIDIRWSGRLALTLGSPNYRYLSEGRGLPHSILRTATAAGLIRQGPHGSAWFRHADANNQLTGWEERGPQWRGFCRGGSKTLFCFGNRRPLRLCVTEVAIDALSLAALEGIRRDTLYVSTGGGWSPATITSLEIVAAKACLVAATDADPQGNAYADRLRYLADRANADFVRLTPCMGDWNEVLKEKQERK